jgi:hypothetical protein
MIPKLQAPERSRRPSRPATAIGVVQQPALSDARSCILVRAVAGADDCFRLGGRLSLATASATKHPSGTAGIAARADDRPQVRAHLSTPARPVIGGAPTLDPLVLLSRIAARRSLALSRASTRAGPATTSERATSAFAIERPRRRPGPDGS